MKPANWRVGSRSCPYFVAISGMRIDYNCQLPAPDRSRALLNVLALGTGARIVTSHDDVCLIEFRCRQRTGAPRRSSDHKKRARYVHWRWRHNDQLLQFCATPRSGALKIAAGLPHSGLRRVETGGDGWGGRHRNRCITTATAATESRSILAVR